MQNARRLPPSRPQHGRTRRRLRQFPRNLRHHRSNRQRNRCRRERHRRRLRRHRRHPRRHPRRHRRHPRRRLNCRERKRRRKLNRQHNDRRPPAPARSDASTPRRATPRGRRAPRRKRSRHRRSPGLRPFPRTSGAGRRSATAITSKICASFVIGSRNRGMRRRRRSGFSSSCGNRAKARGKRQDRHPSPRPAHRTRRRRKPQAPLGPGCRQTPRSHRERVAFVFACSPSAMSTLTGRSSAPARPCARCSFRREGIRSRRATIRKIRRWSARRSTWTPRARPKYPCVSGNDAGREDSDADIVKV